MLKSHSFGCASCGLEWVRLGIAFEAIEWATVEGLRGLNDGVSSLCGLVVAYLPDYLHSAPLGFDYRQSLEDYLENRGTRVDIGFEGYSGDENVAILGEACLTNCAGVEAG